MVSGGSGTSCSLLFIFGSGASEGEVLELPEDSNPPAFGVSFDVTNKLLDGVSVLVAGPKEDVPGVDDVGKLNLEGAGVDVGVVDSWGD